MMIRFKRLHWILLTFILLLFCVAPLSAQGTPLIPINVGENRPGDLSAAAPTATFSIAVTVPQQVTLQVLALAQGMQPAVTVIDPSGVVIQTIATPNATIVQGDVNFTGPGTYIIEVRSTNSVLGGFVISLQPGAALAPAQPITLGQVINGLVDPQTSLLSYVFPGSQTEVITLNVSAPPGSLVGAIVTLKDATTGETLALASARLVGVRFQLPPGSQTYSVLVSHSGAAAQEAFSLCVGTASGPTSCPTGGGEVAQIPTAPPGVTPTVFQPVFISPTAPCAVASSSGAVINVRSAPNTNSNVIGRLQPTATATVLGRLPDSSWYLVNLSGLLGWISGSVVIVGGQCGGVSVVTPTPGATQTLAATATPTASATLSATSTPTATATPTPPPVATLNFSLPPVYGSTALTSGFVPDPFTVGVTAGGPASASYLGGGCTGYMTSAPSFSVNYTSGAFPTLRFYFIGSADTTMVINSPSGSYFCVDDSFGTLNPTIDFNSPGSGRYDVWIGTFASGGSVGGTLYVTENTGNHP